VFAYFSYYSTHTTQAKRRAKNIFAGVEGAIAWPDDQKRPRGRTNAPSGLRITVQVNWVKPDTNVKDTYLPHVLGFKFQFYKDASTPPSL